jgi:hypothetical protein
MPRTRMMSARLRSLCRAVSHGLVLASVALLAACATPAEPTLMSVGPLQGEKPLPAPLASSMCVRNITGGASTNPLWVSQVGDAEFRQALETSLRNEGLLAAGPPCKYNVDANLLGLSQPIFGLDIDVTSNINYKAVNAANQPFLLETVSALYTATFSESPIGFVRLKRANEGSIRTNITKFMQKLRDSTPN